MLQRRTGPLLATMLAAMLCAASASAREPSAGFDPGKLKGPAKGVPNEVMVLGTAHLKYLPPAFQPASLDPLLARLRAWKPRIIAIENLSGSQCAFLRQYPQRYADTVKNYCWDPAPAHAATGLDVLAATQEAERLLAAALGLERVVAMDDHTADAPDADPKAYGEAITKAWNNPANARRKQADTLLRAGVGNAEGVMALYRAYNDPAQARAIFDSDFGAALEEPSPQQFGRGYVAYWETRNLRMASNIREAIGMQPGSRTLVIVGASHKWYLEAYLDRMHDVRIVPSGRVLR